MREDPAHYVHSKLLGWLALDRSIRMATPNRADRRHVRRWHEEREALGRDIRAQIDKVFGKKVFKTVITKSVRLEESPAYKESIFTFAPDSSGAAEYYRLCEEVIDRA